MSIEIVDELIDNDLIYFENKIIGKVCRNKKGHLHNPDGPAVETPDGRKFWYKNGVYHRLDGPAINFPNGTKEWWVEGVRIEEPNNAD